MNIKLCMNIKNTIFRELVISLVHSSNNFGFLFIRFVRIFFQVLCLSTMIYVICCNIMSLLRSIKSDNNYQSQIYSCYLPVRLRLFGDMLMIVRLFTIS